MEDGYKPRWWLRLTMVSWFGVLVEVVKTLRGSRLSVLEAYGRIPFPLLPCCRVVCTWKSGLCLRPCIFQSLVIGCCRIGFGMRALLGSTVDTCSTGGFG